MQYCTFVITRRLSSGSEHLYQPNTDLGEKSYEKQWRRLFA